MMHVDLMGMEPSFWVIGFIGLASLIDILFKLPTRSERRRVDKQ